MTTDSLIRSQNRLMNTQRRLDRDRRWQRTQLAWASLVVLGVFAALMAAMISGQA